MKRFRTALLGVVVAVPVFVAACGDSGGHIAAPEHEPSDIAAGTYRTTTWLPGNDGLTFVAANEGVFRSTRGSKPPIDAGATLHLDAQAIARLKEEADAEVLIGRILSTGQHSSVTSSMEASGVRRRPSVRGAKRIALGTVEGKTVAMEFLPNTSRNGRPPASVVSMVDGQATSIKTFRYKRREGTWVVSHTTTTFIDSMGRPRLVAITDLGDRQSAEAPGSSWTRLRSKLDVVGAGIVEWIQPDALHAATLSTAATAGMDDEEACLREKIHLGLMIAAEVVAAGSYILAAASCVTLGPLCIPTLVIAQIAWVAADVALALAIVDLNTCLYPPKPEPIYTSQGGGGGEQEECWDLDWYVSYDGGQTWAYDETEQVCQYVT